MTENTYVYFEYNKYNNINIFNIIMEDKLVSKNKNYR